MALKNHLHPFDIEIGNKIKSRRKELSLSLKTLSNNLGTNYQQIQKYETGENRVPATILHMISQQLNTSLDYFFKQQDNNELIQNDIIKKSNHPLKILVIEDNPLDQKLFQEAINETNDKCLTHAIYDGSKVMDFLKNKNHNPNLPFQRPDIIFLDLNLPGKNGYDILREIKKSKKLSLIPIIIITNSIHYKDLEKCYELQASSFLTKALEIKQFKEDIKNLIFYWSNTVILAR